MRYLWVSNSPQAPSAYGQQTALFAPRVKRSGREIVLFGFTHQGAPSQFEGILQLPRLVHPFGNDVAVAHLKNTGCGAAISLIDAFALDPSEYRQIPWCAWTPVDSEPVYPGTVNSLNAARWIWAMSRFGERVLKEAGFEKKISYVPHGVDTRVFAPSNRHDARKVVEQAIGAPLGGKFLVAMVAANKSAPSRKGFFEAFSAFKILVDRHPDAVLYVHSEASSVFGGEELPAVAALAKLAPSQVVFAPQYALTTGAIRPEFLARVYGAADVYLSAAHSEGFGIPIVESQACGTPVCAPDNTSQRELCMTGWLAEAIPYMSLGHTIWKRPSVPALAEALERAYEAREDAKVRAAAREKALAYDADRVFRDHMLPALARIEQEIR